MNPYGEGGMTAAAIEQMLNDRGLGDVGTYLVSTLPDPASASRRTAWVTDLYADQPTPGGRVVSEGGFWKPIRPLATASPVMSGNMVLTPLLHSPTQIVSGVIPVGATRTITFATAGAYPGARFRTIRKATGGLGSLFSVVGTLLPLSGWADHEFDPSSNTWVQTASGGLL